MHTVMQICLDKPLCVMQKSVLPPKFLSTPVKMHLYIFERSRHGSST